MARRRKSLLAAVFGVGVATGAIGSNVARAPTPPPGLTAPSETPSEQDAREDRGESFKARKP